MLKVIKNSNGNDHQLQSHLIDREKELVKRIKNMENDGYICCEMILSKKFKKFAENWSILIKMINMHDVKQDAYILKFHMNGQITCTCENFAAKQLKIACKHVLYILGKYNDLNYLILLNNEFVLSKQILEQYENIIESAEQNRRCYNCLNINEQHNKMLQTDKYICDICSYFNKTHIL